MFVEGILRFKSLKARDSLEHSDPNYRPLYLSNSFNKDQRKIAKFLSQFNWFVPGACDHSWKKEVPISLMNANSVDYKEEWWQVVP